MATAGSLVTKQQMVDDINALTTSKNNSIVWTSASNGLNPTPVSGWTYSSSAACTALLSSALTPVATSALSANRVTASDIVTAYKNLAKTSTRIKLYRLTVDFLWGNGCGNQDFRDFSTAYTVTAFATSQEVAALKTAIDNIAGPASNDVVTASSINNFVTSLTTEANKSTTSTYQSQCYRTACHCNCHTSCHASRARR
jgi:hypothetical protein